MTSTEQPEDLTPPALPEAESQAESESASPNPAVQRAAAQAAPPSGGRTAATGRRKESVARVRLIPVSGAATGTITVNRKSSDAYFPREALRWAISQPLVITHQLGKYHVVVNVGGGGMTGQAGAIRLGIARALVEADPSHRGALRGAGFLTRDPRMRERKKYGQKGARKQFQWTKR